MGEEQTKKIGIEGARAEENREEGREKGEKFKGNDWSSQMRHIIVSLHPNVNYG